MQANIGLQKSLFISMSKGVAVLVAERERPPFMRDELVELPEFNSHRFWFDIRIYIRLGSCGPDLRALQPSDLVLLLIVLQAAH